MTFRIKNWTKFQHFKDRRPPWVKLYRDLLDDMEWHQLEPRAAKALVMLWLIASENDGELPEAKTLAFRLRTTERAILDVIAELSHWLEQDDISAISGGYQGDAPERETEKSRERDRKARDFQAFYEAYPKKKAPADAEKAFAKVDVPLATLLAAVDAQKRTDDWRKDGGRYVPYPATWLNQRQWENEITTPTVTVPGSTERDPTLKKLDEDAKTTAPPSLETLAAMAEARKKFASAASSKGAH